MYHHVLKKGGFIASSAEDFASQMRFLAEAGYKTLTMSEFIAYKKGELAVPKKSVLVTFDDGWKDNYVYAYPILRERATRRVYRANALRIQKSSAPAPAGRVFEP